MLQKHLFLAFVTLKNRGLKLKLTRRPHETLKKILREALKKMKEHNVNEVDNLLLEWIIAIECISSEKSRVERIFPIASGSFDSKKNQYGDLFKEKSYTFCALSTFFLLALNFSNAFTAFE